LLAIARAGDRFARSCPTVPRYVPGMARILLVRHGQSIWNADGRWQGQADPPLSELGEQQAVAAARAVGIVDAVYASDLVRASRTAELVADHLGADVLVDPRLRERHAGPWQGRTKTEIAVEWPGYLESGERPDGYEADDSVVARVLAALGAIAEAHDGDVLVVTHGGVVRVVERHLGDDADELVPNLGGRWVEADGSLLRLGERVVLLDESQVTRPQQL
jgi:broad specificity phosphatase PhoE